MHIGYDRTAVKYLLYIYICFYYLLTCFTRNTHVSFFSWRTLNADRQDSQVSEHTHKQTYTHMSDVSENHSTLITQQETMKLMKDYCINHFKHRRNLKEIGCYKTSKLGQNDFLSVLS